MKRVHVYYSGMVQGVGFRYTAMRFATQYGLAGWVKNLPDGRVELTAEGGQDDLESLLSDIQGQFGQFIKDQKVDYKDANGSFKDFRITY